MINLSSENERCGKLLAIARENSGKTQAECCEGMQMSMKTLYNWETGYYAPTFPQIIKYFQVLQQNPVPYLYFYTHSQLYNLPEDEARTKALKEQLIDIVNNELTSIEIEELLFWAKGNHGSSRYAVLQEMTANLHSTMASRHVAAEIVLINFERDRDTNKLVCPDEIMPDMITLNQAITAGRRASRENRNTYTI